MTDGPTPVQPPSPTEWARLESLLDILLDTPPDQRRVKLAELSGGNEARRAELERLLAECERPDPLLDASATERFAALVDDDPLAAPAMLAERYQIVRELGRGGMAIVYAARDVKHGRDIAVKVLRPEVAAALGRARFLREIEIAAQLRHPTIVPLYDSGETDGFLFYVMPLEEGRSLRDRLARGDPLPVDEALAILHDVCDALAYAHAHGVVHRDIKPDNVLLAGRHAMVSDFGIARAVTAATGVPLTIDSALLGTPGYMAPEQVAGQAADQRADLYAVGVLAYEMLTGRPPFAGTSPQQVLTAHLVQTPVPISTYRTDIPGPVAALIMRCLAKEPGDRWQSADDLLAALRPFAGGPREAPVVADAARGRRASRVQRTIGVALGIAGLGVVAAVLARRGDPPRMGLGQTRQVTSERGLEVQPSLSPDGKHVAYAVGNSLRTHLVVRPVAGGRPIRLTNDTTENEWFPRWSPDGARILFLSRGGVFTAPAFGGAARQEIPSRPDAMVRAATWSPDGREIAYVRDDSLLARNLATGAVRLITTGTDLHSCSWSPDGRFLACVAGNSFYGTIGRTTGGPMFGNLAPSAIVLVPVSGGRIVGVTDTASVNQSPAWSPDGRTLYYVSNREGTRDVYARAIGRRGSPEAGSVRLTTGLHAHSVAVSADGREMVYAVYSTSANVWTIPIPSRPPAAGDEARQVTTGNQTVEGVRVSDDRRWLVYDSDLSGNADVYRVPLGGGEPERLTSSDVPEFRGTISADGRQLAYHTFLGGKRRVFLMPLDGGPVRQLTTTDDGVEGGSLANWSRDGSALTFFNLATSTVFVVRRDATGQWGAPRPVAVNAWRPEWSPDGRHIAFVSPTGGRIGMVAADSGRQWDVYVPGPGDPLAELAIFADNGRELYFKSHDASNRASFWSIPVSGGRPRLLVRLDDPAKASNRFDFASDGRRFYFTVEDRESDLWIGTIVPR